MYNREPLDHCYPLSDSARRTIMASHRDPGEFFWQDSSGRAEILAHSWFFQPTTQLDALVEASRLHRVVVLTGKAGAGKSSLATALARPEIAGGRVPDGFVHAIAILTSDTNPASLGDDLERQLRRSVPGFAEAVAEFGRSVPLPEREKMDALARKVLQPLAYLVQKPEFRIVLDGFDRLPDLTRDAVREAVAAWPENLRIVITARPDTSGCPSGHTLDHGTTPRDALDRYLTSRQVPASAHRAILDRAGGHWLVTRLLADLILNDPAIDLAQLPSTVNETYAKLLDQARAPGASNQTLPPRARAAGDRGRRTGATSFPARAGVPDSGRTEGSHGVRDVLDRLGGLVVCRDGALQEEHAGLFHATLAEYLFDPSASGAGFPLDAAAMHEAMIQAIDALAATAKHDRGDPVHHYAMLREADHLWALGNAERTLASLRSRELPEPRENLRRWLQWLRRFRERFDEDDPNILDLRGSIASSGRAVPANTQEALRLCVELLPEAERALGRDHPVTLTTRGRIAWFTGETGDVREALRLLAELLSDQERALGRDHADSLKTRCYIAHWTEAGRRATGAAAIRRAAAGPWSAYLATTTPTRFRIRDCIAYWTGQLGDAQEPCGSSSELLLDQERLLGRDHPDSLRMRGNIAHWAGRAGDVREALRLFIELLPDQERALGRDHPDTLTTREYIADWTAEAGEAREALRLRTELLPDQERVLGRDHADTLDTRYDIASCTGEVGESREASSCSPSCLADQERSFGRDDPRTLRTRRDRVLDRDAGDMFEASRLLQELLPDSGGALGRDHPMMRLTFLTQR